MIQTKVKSLVKNSLAQTRWGRDILLSRAESNVQVTMENIPEFPIYLDIETTNYCNLKCVMCPRTDLMSRPLAHLEFDLFKKLIDEAAAYGLAFVDLHLFGEPLLYHQTFDMIRYVKQYPTIHSVRMSTNATVLDEERSRLLCESGLDMLYISLDGATKATYEKLRVGGKFDQVCDNIATFLEYKQENGLSKPEVLLQIILMQETADEVDVFRQQWEGLLGPEDKIFIKRFSTFGNTVEDRSIFDNSNQRMGRRTYPCSKLWQSLAVTANGDITICCYDVNARLSVGNIRTTSLKDAWHSVQMNRFREIHRRREFSQIPLCSSCSDFDNQQDYYTIGQKREALVKKVSL
ncbi:MAG: SPASM domain-containing protein [Anaerolineae bacterium]|nr:SPASM domain-containing protein [Anaerolineae bacterium]